MDFSSHSEFQKETVTLFVPSWTLVMALIRCVIVTMAEQMTIGLTGCLMSIIVKLHLTTTALKLGKRILQKSSLKDTNL